MLIIVVKKAWEDDAPKQELVDYMTPEEEGEHGCKIVNFVAINDGSRGVEHLLMNTYNDFMIHVNEAELDRDGKSRSQGNNECNSGGKDSRNGKHSGGRHGQSDVHHYKADASRSCSNKSASH
jgi:hypothetical protein